MVIMTSEQWDEWLGVKVSAIARRTPPFIMTLSFTPHSFARPTSLTRSGGQRGFLCTTSARTCSSAGPRKAPPSGPASSPTHAPPAAPLSARWMTRKTPTTSRRVDRWMGLRRKGGHPPDRRDRPGCWLKRSELDGQVLMLVPAATWPVQVSEVFEALVLWFNSPYCRFCQGLIVRRPVPQATSGGRGTVRTTAWTWD